MNDTIDELMEVIEDTLQRRKGNIVIPAFALGRTQELLFLLADLRRQGRLPPIQVFVDSPMAEKVTAITRKHPEVLDDAARSMLAPGASSTTFATTWVGGWLTAKSRCACSVKTKPCGPASTPPGRTFVVHGEAETARGFADTVAAQRGWPVEAPGPGSHVDL